MKTFKIIALISVVILFAKPSISQTNTFKKMFDLFDIDYNLYNIKCYKFNNDKSYLVIGDGFGLSILKIDNTGNIYANKSYSFAYGNIIFLNDTTFESLSISGYGSYLLKLDTSLNVLSSIQYNNLYPAKFSETFDKGFILGGSTSNKIPFLFKTDSLGNLKWANQINNFKGGIVQIVQSPDSTNVVAMNLDTSGATVTKIDSLGNILWSKSYFRPRGCLRSMIQNSDGTILITGNIDSIGVASSYGYISPLFVAKLDPSGNIIWAKVYGDSTYGFRSNTPPPVDIKLTHDGGYIIVATLARQQYNDDVVLIKIDTNGDTLWVVAHGSPSTFEYSSTIEQLNDNGYIISGGTNGFISNNAIYIVRTDSFGHTDSMCQEYNPSIPVNSIFPTDSNIVVTTTPFSITISTPSITTSSYSGLEMDACLLNNIELFAINKNSFSTYPNPTNGVINIKTLHLPDYTKQNYLTVYDTMGKIVIQKSFTNTNEQQIDLNKYGKGIYLIKINEGNNVSTSRVVVE